MKKLSYLIAMALMAFTFTSCEDVPSPFGDVIEPIDPEEEETVDVDPTGSGTEADPYNVAAALEVCATMTGDDAAKEAVVKGYISSIDDMSTSYGNCTYKICDDAEGKTTSLIVYRGYGLDGAKFTSGDEIKQGDLVVVSGGLVNFKGNTPEFTTGSKILSINGEGGGGGDDPSGETLGTKDAPLTIAQALEYINKLDDGGETEQYAYVKGKVVKVTTNADNFAKYGNLNYLISEDGSDGTTITVYSGDGLDGAKFTSITDLEPGDEVIVYGKLYKYVKDSKVTPEIAKGNYLVSLVKGSGGGGGGEGEAKGSGTKDDPYNVVAIAEIAGKLGDKEVSTEDYYIKGKVCSIKYEFSASYGTATFNISDDGKTGGTEFTAYSVYYLGNQPWVDGNTQIAVNDEVILYGKVTNYGGTLETSSKKAYIYSLNGKTDESGGGGGGGSDTGADGSTIVTVAQFNEAAVSTDVWYQLTGTVKNLKDGDQYGNFDLEDSTGSVYVYGLLAEKGGAKKKFQDLVSAQGIANGKTITIVGNRGVYGDKIEVTNAYFISIK